MFFKNVFDDVDENEVVRVVMIDDERFDVLEVIHF